MIDLGEVTRLYLAACKRADAAEAEVERLRKVLHELRAWADHLGVTLIPTGDSADTYGDGVRASKTNVKQILAAYHLSTATNDTTKE